MNNFLENLACLHFEFGVIGIDEFNDRIDIALWLNGEIDYDPRNEPDIPNSEDSNTEKDVQEAIKIKKINDSLLEFTILNYWIFTKSDPDSYPSVPHGHFQNKNNKWPKLNPYTGKVFKSKDQEDIKRRLSKNELILIWSNEEFRSFCREFIVWYSEFNPYYSFNVRRPLRLPRYK